MTIPVGKNMTIKFPNSDRNKSRLLIIVCLILLLPSLSRSQNIYDLDHSRKYAEFLSASQQHVLAAEEYERLVFFESSNVEFRYKLIKSYRLATDYSKGINRVYSLYGGSFQTMPQFLAKEFVTLELLTDSLSVADRFINQNETLPPELKLVFRSYNLMLNGDYANLESMLQNASANNLTLPRNLMILSDQALNSKYKSPFLAAGFSTIIPGSGKFYTKNWTDGIMSLLFVAGNAWQAHRGFKEDGVKSAYGWVFASLSTSFYIGNIFGSAKSAKRYNTNKKNEIRNQIYEALRSDTF